MKEESLPVGNASCYYGLVTRGTPWVKTATAGVLALASVACGAAEPPAPPPEPVAPVTRAVDAVLEERDEKGELLWRVTARTLDEKGGVVACDSVLLDVTPHGAAQFGSRPRGLGTGLAATAGSGLVLQGEETRLVRLRDGFRVVMENGWEIRGDELDWDGRLMVSDSPVTVSRPGMTVRGERAVIEPERNRFSLRRVRGVFEGVSL